MTRAVVSETLLGTRRNLAEAQFGGHRAVVALGTREQGDQQRDDHQQQPRAFGELLAEQHDGRDGGEARAEPVERGAWRPSRTALPLPVPDESPLAQGEPDEDADRVQRKQPMRLGVDQHQNRARRHGECRHAVTEHRAFGAQREQRRHPAILRQQREQHRQPTETGVRRQTQCQRDGQVHDIERPPRTERGRGELSKHRHATARHHMVQADQQCETHQHDAQQHTQRDLGVLRAPDGRSAERGHRVGDRLDTRQRRTSRRESFEQQPDSERFDRNERPGIVTDHGHRLRPQQADPDHAEYADNEQQGRCQQHPGRLRDTDQIHHGDHRERTERDGELMVTQHGKRAGQARGARREADRDRQHVVHHQTGRGEQARTAPEVLLRDRVRPAAVRMRRDHLPVREDEHQQQRRDRQRHRKRPLHRRRARHHEHQDDGLRPVRDTGQRVERQRGEPPERGEPVRIPALHPAHPPIGDP